MTTNNSGGSAPAPAAAPAAPSQQSIADLMAFDPFQSSPDGRITPATPSAPSAEKSGDGSGGAPAAPKADPVGTQVTPSTPQPGAPAAPMPGPATPPQPDVSKLQGQVEQMRQMLTESLTRVPQAPATPAAPEKPHFQFQLPDVVANAIRSEDPAEARAGMNVLVNGLANAIRQDYTKMVQEQVFPAVMQIVGQQIALYQEQQKVQADFYGTYKEFDHPQLKPVVAQVAMTVAQEQGATSWTPELSKAIAERLHLMFPGVKAPQTPPPPAPPSPPQQPFIGGVGARPAAGVADVNDGAQMLESIGLKM